MKTLKRWLGLRKSQPPVAAHPTVYLTRSQLEDARDRVLACTDEWSSEVTYFMLCQRIWQRNAPAFQAKATRVLKTADFLIQSDHRLVPSPEVMGQVIEEVRTTNYHLLMVHTHPPDSVVNFSAADLQTAADLAIELQAFPGQKSLLFAVYNHYLSLNGESKFLHFQGMRSEPLIVRHPADDFVLQGKDYTEVGSLVEAHHQCSSRSWIGEQTAIAAGIEPGVWKGVMAGDNSDRGKIWEDMPLDQVYVKVTHWPIECGCGFGQFKGKTASLAELGYTGIHPWRSG